METNILKFELSVGRALDDNTLDTITASIGIPVEADDDAVNEAVNSDELIAYAVGVLYDLAAYMRPQWLDGEDAGMTLEAYFGDSIQQNSIAVKVKLSDLRSNMDLTRLPHTPTERDLERTRKYKRAYTILSSREGISAVNPYALYDYLLANNWSVKRKSTRTPVLETTDGSAEINAPIDLALADYESRMANALGVLCSYEDVLLSNVIVRIVAWKPDKQ